MSGNAALSAARKRRASSGPNSGMNNGQPTAYYNGTNVVQNLQGMNIQSNNGMRQSAQSKQMLVEQPLPNIPINIYENIELIKQQISQRVKLIQSEGSTMPPERLRMLHKQNEIQGQILKQKIAMAQEMEMTEKAMLQQQATKQSQIQAQNVLNSSSNEPEFIYEKGIPRRNPKFKTPAELQAFAAQAKNEAMMKTQQQSEQQSSSISKIKLTPFVSMINETGAVPPPIVVLKSHDAKLEEHDSVINELTNRLNYIHSRMDQFEVTSSQRDTHVSKLQTIRESSTNHVRVDEDNDGNIQPDDDAEGNTNAEDETELLMDVVMNDLTNSREFVEGIVTKIVTETNLSEVIMKIEPIVKENQELRSLIHSQQQMMNEMNTMLMRLLNQQESQRNTGNHNVTSVSCGSSYENENDNENEYKMASIDSDGLYQPEEMTEVVLQPAQEENADADADAKEVDVQNHDDEHEHHDDEHEHHNHDQEQDHPEQDHDDDDIANTHFDVDAYDQEPHFPEHIALIVNEIA